MTRRPERGTTLEAVGRWEGEGGDPGGVEPVAQEPDLLRLLGAAVVARWASLGTGERRELFREAATDGVRRGEDDLPERLGRFLHEHHTGPR